MVLGNLSKQNTVLSQTSNPRSDNQANQLSSQNIASKGSGILKNPLKPGMMSQVSFEPTSHTLRHSGTVPSYKFPHTNMQSSGNRQFAVIEESEKSEHTPSHGMNRTSEGIMNSPLKSNQKQQFGNSQFENKHVRSSSKDTTQNRKYGTASESRFNTANNPKPQDEYKQHIEKYNQKLIDLFVDLRDPCLQGLTTVKKTPLMTMTKERLKYREIDEIISGIKKLFESMLKYSNDFFQQWTSEVPPGRDSNPYYVEPPTGQSLTRKSGHSFISNNTRGKMPTTDKEKIQKEAEIAKFEVKYKLSVDIAEENVIF